MVAWDPGVVLVDFAVAFLPVVELGSAQADPAEEAADGNLGLVGPGVDEIDEVIAGVMGHPALGQRSPRFFFNCGVLFHEFGEDLILALELGFELLDLVILGVFGGSGSAAIVEAGLSVLEQEPLPGVEEVGLDAELFTELRNRGAFDQVPFEDGHLVGGGKMTPGLSVVRVVRHGRYLRTGYANPCEGIFQIRLGQYIAGQCEYFLDVASEYKCDFIVFPEIFTTQLLSLVQAENPAAAMRKLSDFTPAYLELFTRLAVKHNVNVIGGSHFTVEDNDLFNIAYLFPPRRHAWQAIQTARHAGRAPLVGSQGG